MRRKAPPICYDSQSEEHLMGEKDLFQIGDERRGCTIILSYESWAQQVPCKSSLSNSQLDSSVSSFFKILKRDIDVTVLLYESTQKKSQSFIIVLDWDHIISFWVRAQRIRAAIAAVCIFKSWIPWIEMMCGGRGAVKQLRFVNTKRLFDCIWAKAGSF